MAGLKTFLTGLFIGSTTSLVAMQIHVVNTDDGLTVLPRAHRPPVSTTYVDVREWSLAMWRQHPEVAEAAVKSGRVDLLGDGALNSIFPKQAESGTQTVPSSNLAGDKAKLAMEALVPIKFTTPEGQQKIVTPNVPYPASFEDILPKHFTEQNHQLPDSKQAGSSIFSQIENAFPQDIQLNESLLNGLPKLQRPIPIHDAVVPSAPAARAGNQATRPAGGKTDLFTDVLKALIPPKAKEQASAIVPQHSVAHPAYRIEAPAPHSQQVSPQSNQQNNQPSVPIVRPF